MGEKIKINRIKAVLAEKDITQKELTHRVSKTPNTITRICKKRKSANIETTQRDCFGAGSGYKGAINFYRKERLLDNQYLKD